MLNKVSLSSLPSLRRKFVLERASESAGDMRLAPKVVFLVGGADGFGSAISDALHAGPGSDLTREQSHFELSLERYGVKDRRATGDLIHFLDHDGSSQVSIIVLPNYEPPVAACAVNEILASIMSDNSSELLTVIVPFFLSSQKIIHDSTNPKFSESGVAVFGVGIGQVTESTQAMLAGIPRPPPSLRVNCETLACLLQMIRVLKMPTILIGTIIKCQSITATAQDYGGLNALGELLANCIGLCFLGDKICWREREKMSVQEPWQALYG